MRAESASPRSIGERVFVSRAGERAATDRSPRRRSRCPGVPALSQERRGWRKGGVDLSGRRKGAERRWGEGDGTPPPGPGAGAAINQRIHRSLPAVPGGPTGPRRLAFWRRGSRESANCSRVSGSSATRVSISARVSSQPRSARLRTTRSGPSWNARRKSSSVTSLPTIFPRWPGTSSSSLAERTYKSRASRGRGGVDRLRALRCRSRAYATGKRPRREVRRSLHSVEFAASRTGGWPCRRPVRAAPREGGFIREDDPHSRRPGGLRPRPVRRLPEEGRRPRPRERSCRRTPSLRSARSRRP